MVEYTGKIVKRYKPKVYDSRGERVYKYFMQLEDHDEKFMVHVEPTNFDSHRNKAKVGDIVRVTARNSAKNEWRYITFKQEFQIIEVGASEQFQVEGVIQLRGKRRKQTRDDGSEYFKMYIKLETKTGQQYNVITYLDDFDDPAGKLWIDDEIRLEELSQDPAREEWLHVNASNIVVLKSKAVVQAEPEPEEPEKEPCVYDGVPSLEDIKDAIVVTRGMKESEVDELVKAEIEKTKGLLTEVGAAIIVADSLKVNYDTFARLKKDFQNA
jgi:hypothetical protein